MEKFRLEVSGYNVTVVTCGFEIRGAQLHLSIRVR